MKTSEKIRRSPRVAVALVLALPACSPDATGPVPDTTVAAIDPLVSAYVQSEEIDGAAVAIARQGRLVFASAYGFADLAHRMPLEPDHVFRVASVSKPITAIAVLKAVDEGLLSLDDRVFDHLADLLPAGGPTDPRVLETTVAQHLHHTPGWDQVGYPADPLHRMKEIAAAMGVPSPPSSETLARWIAGQGLADDPGTTFRYTNIGYVLLARALERVTGMPYEEYVRTRVLAPVGITRARLGRNRREDRFPDEVEYRSYPDDIWVSIYEGEQGPVAEPAYGALHIEGLDGSSGWVLSAVDLARLGAAVDGEPTVPDILSPEMRAFMVSPSPIGSAYGAGFFLASADEAAAAGYPRLAVADHGGGMPGTNAYFQVREDGLVISVIINTDRRDFFDTFATDLVRTVYRVAEWPDVDLFPQFE